MSSRYRLIIVAGKPVLQERLSNVARDRARIAESEAMSAYWRIRERPFFGDQPASGPPVSPFRADSESRSGLWAAQKIGVADVSS